MVYKINKFCKNCGKRLSRKDAKRCKPCSLKAQHKQNHPNYKTGITLIKHYCIDCNKEVSHYLTKRCRNCADKQHSKFMKGNKLAYIHGKCYLPYNKNWRYIREFVRNKYNLICQICGDKGKDIHHIDYNKPNCSLNNLICLCHSCHCKTNVNRDYWYAYFKYRSINEY